MHYKKMSLALTLSHMTSAVNLTFERSCPDVISIDGYESAFEHQFDGSYRNKDDSIIAQNEDDLTWFIMGSAGPGSESLIIVSFDQSECPYHNKKWHRLENLQYTDYEVKFL